MSIRRAAFVASVVAATAASGLVPAGARAEEKRMERTVTVTASGTVEAAPDRARVNTGVTVEASTARDALTKNTESMTKVIAELKGKGVDGKDIQTSSFNIDPIMVYPKEGSPPQITGYRVTNQVSVLVRDLAKLGEVLDQLVTAGANQVNSLDFEVSKAETLKDDARKAAMSNAYRRAELLAKAGGAELGSVLQIAEDVAFAPPRPYGGVRMAKAEMAAPIEQGTETLEARVTVTWELK